MRPAGTGGVGPVDPDGAKPREDAVRSQVDGWRKPLDNGLTRWQFDLDPERDAYVTRI